MYDFMTDGSRPNMIRSCCEIITSSREKLFHHSRANVFISLFFFEKCFVCFTYDLFLSHSHWRPSCSASFSRWFWQRLKKKGNKSIFPTKGIAQWEREAEKVALWSLSWLSPARTLEAVKNPTVSSVDQKHSCILHVFSLASLLVSRSIKFSARDCWKHRKWLENVFALVIFGVAIPLEFRSAEDLPSFGTMFAMKKWLRSKTKK